ncbi:MAG: glycine cleavage system protein GcvH [Armatimonadota bacterium]
MKRVVLPCNGLDKAFGVLSCELALKLCETNGAQIVCPVLLNNSPARYEKTLAESDLLVIDGCPTRCASKLANNLGLKVDDKILVSEQAKSSGLEIGDSLRPDPVGMQLVDMMINDLAARESDISTQELIPGDFESPVDFLSVTHDKFIFKIPSQGYLFSENDTWVRVIGSRARVGVTDFVQQNLTDITYFEPAQAGSQIEQFDEVGSLESGKSMTDVLSPVSGRIIAVNIRLADSPELVNEDPYGNGWIAEIELADFDSDKELLLDAQSYSRIVEKKAAEVQK